MKYTFERMILSRCVLKLGGRETIDFGMKKMYILLKKIS